MTVRKRFRPISLWVFFTLTTLTMAMGTWGQLGCGPIEPGIDGLRPDGSSTDGGNKELVGGDQPGTDKTPVIDETRPTDQPGTDRANPDKGQEPTPDTTPEAPADEISKPAFLQPTGFTNLKLPVKKWALPAALLKNPITALEVQSNGSILFGASSGLYETNGTKVTKVANTRVVGIAPWKATKMLVAEAKAIYLWDGGLLATKLYDFLDGSNITAIESRAANTLWIGTEKALWLLTNDVVREFKAISGVKHLEYVPGFQVVLITDQNDKHMGLELAKDGTWQLRDFSTEGTSFSQMAPHPETLLDFWGLDPQAGLYLRKANGDNAAWWRFRLMPDANEDETVKLNTLIFHPKPNTTWALGAKSLYRLSEKTVGIQPKPTDIGTVSYSAGTVDGGLWLSDGKALFRIGQTGPAVSYAKEIAPIITASCTKCHAPGGKASFAPFQTYAQVKNKAALIIKRLNQNPGGMPPSGPLPKTTIDIVQNWINGGTQP